MGTSLKVYINKAKRRSRDNRFPLYLRIIHNTKKSEGKINTTPINESDLGYWNEETQRFNSKQKKFNAHNIVLNQIQNEFHNFLQNNITQMSDKTPHEICNYLLSRNKSKNLSVIDAANQFYLDVILPDINKASGTKRNYKKSMNHLIAFLKYQKLVFISVKEFERIHASKFISYLKNPIPEIDKVGLNDQSVHSVIKNVKPLFQKLLFEERITRNPFIGIKIPFKLAKKPRLSNENFKSLAKLDLSNKRTLEIYRDLFLFLCYTGMSYCDATNLRLTDVEHGYISIQRKKSKVLTKQYLTKQTKALIEKYKNSCPENRILPKRSLDKLNLNLKLLAVMSEIDFPLTTYTARRFFRQSIFEAGIKETLVVKSLMGHTALNDIDSHYFYISDNILTDAKKKLQKYFKKLLK